MTTIMFTSSSATCSSSNLKRKRDEFGSMRSTNTHPAPANHGHISVPTAGMETLNLRGEIHSRTMKRIRNKPKEQEVYDYTLQKLFNAQCTKQTLNQPSIQSATPTPPAQKVISRPSISKYFASFFTSSKPQSKPANKQDSLLAPALSPSIPICDDCDRPLQEGELYLSGEGQCIDCHRTVCSEGCSVAVTDGVGGEGRVCLECALRK